MANLQAISKEGYADKKWQLNPGFSFAAKHSVSPLVFQELTNAMACMPIAFMPNKDKYVAVAVQGLTPETNLFVDADGNWLGKWVPAVYRSYPFILASTSGDGENLVLSVDEDSGLVGGEEADQVFFDETGELSEQMKEVMKFLSEGQNGRIAINRICEQLQEHDLITPWNLKLEYTEGPYQVDGLFCINEPIFQALSDEAFIELRKTGALSLIYSQLLSMQQISNLADAARALAKPAAGSQADEQEPSEANVPEESAEPE